MNWIKKILFIGLWIFMFLIWAIGGIFYFQATQPYSDHKRSQIFQVKKGMNLKQVAYALSEKQLIRSPSSFRLVAYLQRKQNKIKAGEFKLSPSMPPMELLNQITSGQAILYPVTIPEGYRISEIADLLARKGLADKNRFIQAAENKKLINALSIPSGSLEGYLFPETYHFSKNSTEKKFVSTMLTTFKEKVLRPEYIQRASELGMTFHETITLASIIEKETGQPRERNVISSVFHNRLRKKMRLQSDPTVIYALPRFDGNIHKKDLSVNSPYNTYRNGGLPPGPIASPGLYAIQAALYPSQTNHLYFVSRKDGSHQFSKNLKDHNRAVQKYQLKNIRKR